MPAAPAAAAPAPVPQPAARPAIAEQAVFHKGSNVVNLGVGFGLGEALVGSNVSSMPALSASYTRGVAQVGPGTISVGGLVGYKSYRWNYSTDKATWRHYFVGARGAYHYSFDQPKLDAYAGVGLGFHTASYAGSQSASASSTGSQLELSGYIGARYFFTNAIGGFAELGYDMSLLKVGVSARF